MGGREGMMMFGSEGMKKEGVRMRGMGRGKEEDEK